MNFYTAFLGEAEQKFHLPAELILQLERTTGNTIGEIYQRFMSMKFGFIDVTEIVRLGLIGGGMSPEAALNMIDAYVKHRPIMENFTIAFEVLDRAWNGTEANADDAADVVQTIDDALEQVAP